MIQRTHVLPSLAVIGLAFVACRPGPDGEPVYPVYEEFVAGDELPGPFPYVEGEDRLFLGTFYESGFSEEVPIDNSTTNYFIYESTYTQQPSDDRVEGLESSEFTITDAQLWWGGGIVWDPPLDMSDWTTLHVSLKATDALFETTDIIIESVGGVSTRVQPAAFGFQADGAWHSLVIPLSEFTAPDFSAIRIPFSMVNGAGATGSVLLVDDVYYTQE